MQSMRSATAPTGSAEGRCPAADRTTLLIRVTSKTGLPADLPMDPLRQEGAVSFLSSAIAEITDALAVAAGELPETRWWKQWD